MSGSCRRSWQSSSLAGSASRKPGSGPQPRARPERQAWASCSPIAAGGGTRSSASCWRPPAWWASGASACSAMTSRSSSLAIAYDKQQCQAGEGRKDLQFVALAIRSPDGSCRGKTEEYHASAVAGHRPGQQGQRRGAALQGGARSRYERGEGYRRKRPCQFARCRWQTAACGKNGGTCRNPGRRAFRDL